MFMKIQVIRNVTLFLDDGTFIIPFGVYTTNTFLMKYLHTEIQDGDFDPFWLWKENNSKYYQRQNK